jgi:S-adenosyl methyltransferase
VSDSSPAPGQPSPAIDTTVLHSARIWNYWLGGSDNFPVDREAGDQYREIFPDILKVARAPRQFLNRSVAYLAGEAGVRQFLDVGAGLPTADNTHQVAQRVAPACRVVYVDHDPMVVRHARDLLTSTPEGATAYVQADLRDPPAILEAPARTLDHSQPVAPPEEVDAFGGVGRKP